MPKNTYVYHSILWCPLVSLSTTTVFFGIGKKNPRFHIYVLILSSKVSEKDVTSIGYLGIASDFTESNSFFNIVHT